jgi:lipopolysaccharide transport system permease protein
MASKTSSDITVIQPPRGWSFPNLREVWDARAILLNFVQRNFNVTYRQTIGGPIYAVYTPFMTMIGYTLLLGVLFGAQEGLSVPYPLFSFCALLVWTLFTNVTQNATTSLTQNTNLIQKIYIPRLVFPLIETCMQLLTFAIAFVVLLLMMVVYAQPFLWQIVWVVFYVAVALVFSLGFGLLFAGFQARFRDMSYLVQTINRLLFFVTPVVYDSTLLPAPFNTLYIYNPMALVIEGMRWAMLNVGEQPALFPTLSAVGVSVALLLVALLVFQRLEPTVADVL